MKTLGFREVLPPEKSPYTVAYIRDELRRNQFQGDIFEALEFLLREYDTVNRKLQFYTKPREYDVV